MSRGHGRIQRLILDLLATDEHGAWTTSDICCHVYRGVNRLEKKHRVAVARALRAMTLPEQWGIQQSSRRGSEYVLYNRLSVDSTSRHRWLRCFGRNHCDFETFKKAYSHQVDKALDDVAEYLRWHNADELGRLTMQIEEAQKRAVIIRAAGAGNAEFFRSIGEEIACLSARRKELEAAALSVSSRQTRPSGNAYKEAEA